MHRCLLSALCLAVWALAVGTLADPPAEEEKVIVWEIEKKLAAVVETAGRTFPLGWLAE